MWARIAAILLCLTATAHAKAHGGSNNIWPIASATITVAGTGICGAVPCTATVNAISPTCFTNPADTVAANTNWTSSSTNYLAAPTPAQFVLQSLTSCQSRDVEVQTWMAKGYVFVRLDNQGNAIYFYHDVTQTNGYLEIGIVQGVNQSAFNSGNYYPLYKNSNLVSTIGASGSLCSCGYSTSASDSQKFTFGVSGFSIYVKYQGTQFASFNEYRQMSSGTVAFQAASQGGNGFRDIIVTPLTTAQLASNYGQGQINVTDYGASVQETTGTITGGTASLAVSSATGFHINDYIVVEIGGESGGGALGTRGVGGNWPSQRYTSAAAMNADTGQAQFTFGWIDDGSGTVKEFLGSTWSAYSSGTTYSAGTYVVSAGTVYLSLQNSNTNNTPASSPTFWQSIGATNTWQTTFTCPSCVTNVFYQSKSIPQALIARITNIVGNTLTLDTNANVTATNANVYFDNQVILNDLTQTPRTGPVLAPITPANVTLVFPVGTFAFGGALEPLNHSGWSIQGAGQAVTFLKAPQGAVGFEIVAENMPNMSVSNLTMLGSIQATPVTGVPFGYTMQWAASAGILSIGPIPSSTNAIEYDASGKILTTSTMNVGDVTQTSIPGDWMQTGGVTFQSSNNASVNNLTVKNVFNNAFQCNTSNNCSFTNSTVNLTYSQQSYTQWLIEFANDSGGTCNGCTISNTYIGGGIECFGSLTSTSGPTFTNMTMQNAAFSLNDCGGWTISNSTSTYTSLSSAPVYTPNSSSGAMVQIDANTGTGSVGLGTITNLTMTANYIDASNNIPPGISITSQITATNISGGSYTGPGYSSGAAWGNVGLTAQGSDVAISNWKACGAVNSGHANIELNTPGTGNSLTSVTYDHLSDGTSATNTSPTTPCP